MGASETACVVRCSHVFARPMAMFANMGARRGPLIVRAKAVKVKAKWVGITLSAGRLESM